MLCPRCTKEIPDDSALCCYCGKMIVKQPQSKIHQRGNGLGTVYKDGKSWRAVFTVAWYTDEEGKLHRKRITKRGFKTKNEALLYLPLLRQTAEKSKEAPTLYQLWLIYSDNKLLKLSKSKQTAYRIAWSKLQSIQFLRIDAISVQLLIDVVNNNAPTYYPAKDMKTLLKHLFRMAAAEGWVNKELPEFIELPALEEAERTPFTKEEQIALWKIYDIGNTNAALPLIMIYTGMMPGEMQSLKLDMIDLEQQRIVGAGIKTKIRKQSSIYLPDIIIPVIESEMASSTSTKGYVWSRNEKAFYKRYYAALEAAGCRRLEPYCCRHTTATALAITNNIAPKTIQKVMRWSSTKMLDHYAHPDDGDALNAINTLNR